MSIEISARFCRHFKFDKSLNNRMCNVTRSNTSFSSLKIVMPIPKDEEKGSTVTR